ncbi:hypothetical protein J3B02_005883 [Coemansia erecta]|uniref:Thioesterase domain-containing protein n=1 Tax=Coemansia asiatica TaxID=1052880 RepID=A0A9W7XL04_9FUNG|nr:hypothetical protein LPJ64_001623 [Coemansia asiatica]KAJ2841462.1 hypothetical protein J3B02_005883 [Coemansia erecta]
MSSGAESGDFIEYVSSIASGKKSHYYYSADLSVQVIAGDQAQQTITARLVASDLEINEAGYIDEGVVSTIADYWTSTLISAVHEGRSSVTTSLSVQSIRPVRTAGTVVDVICQASGLCLSGNPHAVARFVDAEDYRVVYSVVTHTKFFKHN